MRKSFYHILLLGALTLGTTSSCDDYLEVDHYDILPEDFMYRNEANIKSGLYIGTWTANENGKNTLRSVRQWQNSYYRNGCHQRTTSRTYHRKATF